MCHCSLWGILVVPEEPEVSLLVMAVEAHSSQFKTCSLMISTYMISDYLPPVVFSDINVLYLPLSVVCLCALVFQTRTARSWCFGGISSGPWPLRVQRVPPPPSNSAGLTSHWPSKQQPSQLYFFKGVVHNWLLRALFLNLCEAHRMFSFKRNQINK